jgi:hypothetical protein
MTHLYELCPECSGQKVNKDKTYLSCSRCEARGYVRNRQAEAIFARYGGEARNNPREQITIVVFGGSPQAQEIMDSATMVVRSVFGTAPAPEWVVDKDWFGDTKRRLSDAGLLTRIYDHIQRLQDWLAGKEKSDGQG